VGHGKKNAFWKSAQKNISVLQIANELLQLVGFENKAETLAKNLSHGDQRLIEVLLGLSTNPRLLLLDEPTAGLSIKETRDMIVQMKELSRKTIKNIIIVEHDMGVVTELASNIYVLHQGRVLSKGSIEEIKGNSQVREVYLGRSI
jgi:branched-chain amino acid transport system ATP-binding protein